MAANGTKLTTRVTGVRSEIDPKTDSPIKQTRLNLCTRKVLNEPVSDFMTKSVVTAREADTSDWLMSEMTMHRFRHMPVVEMGRSIGLVSIGDLVKMQIAEVEMEAAATLEYAG
jgi:signal-transduction protein with cAMP-binding, CBS, and nucleotidyltransferase domain